MSSVAEDSFHKKFSTGKERDSFLYNKEFMSDYAFIIKIKGKRKKTEFHVTNTFSEHAAGNFTICFI